MPTCCLGVKALAVVQRRHPDRRALQQPAAVAFGEDAPLATQGLDDRLAANGPPLVASALTRPAKPQASHARGPYIWSRLHSIPSTLAANSVTSGTSSRARRNI